MFQFVFSSTTSSNSLQVEFGWSKVFFQALPLTFYLSLQILDGA
jgi:hypothetical protein